MDFSELSHLVKRAKESRPPTAIRVGVSAYAWLKRQAADNPTHTWLQPPILGTEVVLDLTLHPWACEVDR